MRTFCVKTAALPETGTFLIEANAGTGKTHTIQELYRRLVVERGLMPSEILVVTFTNAATAELADRVHKNLSGDDPALRRARSGFDQAAIHTIHGFCMGVLNSHAFECGLAFDAEPLPDITPLVREITADFYRRATTRGPIPQAFGELLKTALLFAKFPNAKPVPAEIPPDPAAVLDALHKELHALPPYTRAPKIKAAYDALRGAGRDGFAAALVTLKDDLLRNADTLPDEYRAFQDGVSAFFETPRLAHLLALHADIAKHFEERKRRRNLLAYDDQPAKVNAALKRPGSLLPGILRQQYRAVFIDEFQDTDPVQCEIFTTLFHGHALLFFIGDPKQAIYGWRGADLNAYLDARDRLEPGHIFSLLDNHRSAPGIINAVNTVFLPDGAFHNEKITYSPSTSPDKTRDMRLLLGGEPEPRPFRRVLFYDPDKPFGNQDELQRLIPVEAAAQITRLLNDPSREFLIQAPGAPPRRRPVLPSDIAVLTRKHEQSFAVRDALLSAGVPAVLQNAGSVFKSPEARGFQLFLATLQNPRDIRPLLASRWCGLDDAALRDEPTLARMAARFNAVRAAWQTSGLATALELFFNAFGTRALLAKGAAPERSLTNLRHLVELTLERQRAASPSLDGLLRWFENSRAHPPGDESHEQRLESDGDAVRILTIHKSKGLTFPIVICPWLQFQFSSKNVKSYLTRDAGGGAVIPLTQVARKMFPKEPPDGDDARLAYVALTRAAHLCVAFAVWPSKDPPPEKPASPAPRDWLCHLAPGDTTVDVLSKADLAPPPTHRPRVNAPQLLRPDPPPPSISRDAEILSYSALKPHAHKSGEEEDPFASDESDDSPTLSLDPDVLPRDNITGNILHKLFEAFDFPLVHSPVETAAVVSRVLANTPLDHAPMRARAAEILRDVLRGWAFPAPEKTTLSAVPFADTRRETRFTLRLSKPLDLRRLRPLGIQADPRLANPNGGFITGIADLLFRANGRYWFMDWKSDSLAGDAFDDLAPLMRGRGYLFQLALYATALHRVLRRSLGASYDPAKHFGGGCCVFIRHLSPRHPNAFYHLAPTPAQLDEWAEVFS
ncbi:MAG: UvrD-helicase domain-containing protein [Kiritimatiellaeota bacterium]|nr:UvrD-helicase domain-containing protein [Kiritimatiellota bacterium]